MTRPADGPCRFTVQAKVVRSERVPEDGLELGIGLMSAKAEIEENLWSVCGDYM